MHHACVSNKPHPLSSIQLGLVYITYGKIGGAFHLWNFIIIPSPLMLRTTTIYGLFLSPLYILSRLDMHSEVQPFCCVSLGWSFETHGAACPYFLRFKIKRFMFTLVCVFVPSGGHGRLSYWYHCHLEYVPSTKILKSLCPFYSVPWILALLHWIVYKSSLFL